MTFLKSFMVIIFIYFTFDLNKKKSLSFHGTPLTLSWHTFWEIPVVLKTTHSVEI